MNLYSIFQKHPVICTDTRNCVPGSIFFALKGDNFNANAFAALALENGCAYAVVDEKEYAISNRYILVDNCLETLQNLAREHRKKLGTTIIGITGTNGKTTTKELIASALKEKYNILYTQGNLNNHIGVPLTLLQLQKEHELAVIEMGANHQGEINLLTSISIPDYGIITNVGKAHLEGFGSFETVKSTKAELYESVKNSGKKIFINSANPHLTEMASTIGINPDNLIAYQMGEAQNRPAVWGEIVDCSPFLVLRCTVENEDITINTQLIGTYNAENVLAAVCIAHYFGLTNEEIVRGLENYKPQNNRSQLTVTERNKLVVDAYNANPTSMRAAIINFAQMQVENKFLLLGDMLELGDQTEDEHQQIVDLLIEKQLKNVLLTGKHFCNTANNFRCFSDVEQLLAYLNTNSIQNAYVLIKGSRGIKLEKTITLL